MMIFHMPDSLCTKSRQRAQDIEVKAVLVSVSCDNFDFCAKPCISGLAFLLTNAQASQSGAVLKLASGDSKIAAVSFCSCTYLGCITRYKGGQCISLLRFAAFAPHVLVSLKDPIAYLIAMLHKSNEGKILLLSVIMGSTLLRYQVLSHRLSGTLTNIPLSVAPLPASSDAIGNQPCLIQWKSLWRIPRI